MVSTFFWYTLVYGAIPFILASPFVGIALYYSLSLLRPQHTWFWSLSNTNFAYHVALATIVGWAVWKIRGERKLAGCRGTNLLMLAYFLWLALSYWKTISPEQSAFWWNWYWKGFLFYLIAVSVLRDVRQMRILLWVITLSTGYLAWDANDQYFFRGIWQVRGLGFGDNNILGTYFVMGLPICFFLMLEEKNKWAKAFLALLLPIFIHAILLTYSRGSMLAGAIMFPILISRVKNKGVAFLVGLVLLGITFRLAGQPIRDRFATIARSEVDSSAQERKRAWQAALAVMREYPFTGVGLRCFGLVSAQYAPVVYGRVAHNSFLQTGADSGIPAMLMLALLIVIQIVTLQKIIWQWKARRDLPFFNYAAALQVSLIGYVCCAMFLSLDAHDHFFVSLALATVLRRLVASPVAVAEAQRAAAGLAPAAPPSPVPLGAAQPSL